MILVDWRISSTRHQIAVVAIAVLADGNLEIQLVVALVGLAAAQVPGDARAAQHHAGEAPVERVLLRLTTPISTLRCLKMRLSVTRLFDVVEQLGEAVRSQS